MTVETETNEVRDIALAHVEELERLTCNDEDAVNWVGDNVYDIRATYSLNPKLLVGVEVMTAGGGPTVWVSYNGNETGTLVVKASWGSDKWESWAKAPLIASYLWELVEAYE